MENAKCSVAISTGSLPAGTIKEGEKKIQNIL